MKAFYQRVRPIIPELSIISRNFIYILFSLLLSFIISYSLNFNHLIFISVISIAIYFIATILLEKGFSITVLWNQLISLLFFITLTCIFCFVKVLFYDYSFDGQMYHQEAVILLKEGWNPILNPLQHLENTVYGISFYPKAIWYLESFIFRVTGQLEASKVFDLILASIVFIKGLITLKKTKLSNTYIITILILFVTSPIAIAQFFSFYIDSIVYYLVLTLIFIGYDLSNKKTFDLNNILQFILISSILANTKFTGIYFSLLFSGGILLYSFLTHALTLIHVFKTGFVIIGITLLIGINPYLTNSINYNNPVYPMITGTNQYNIIGSQMSDYFRELPMHKKLYYSYFGVASRIIPDQAPELRRFGLPTSKEISKFINTGGTPRINGFGLLFTPALILSLIALGFIIPRSNKSQKYFIFMISIVIVSTILNPSGWWARITPATYLIPVLIITVLFIAQSRKKIILGSIISGLLIINNALVAVPVLISQITNQTIASSQLTLIKEGLSYSKAGLIVDFSPMWYSASERLSKNNIPYSISELSQNGTFGLLNTPARFSFAEPIPKKFENKLLEFENKTFEEHFFNLLKRPTN